MNRRELLKLILSGVAGHALDVDRLLWVPGAKKIFLPPVRGISVSAIISAELERITPHIRMLFERDDMFYKTLSGKEIPIVSSRDMTKVSTLFDRDDTFYKNLKK